MISINKIFLLLLIIFNYQILFGQIKAKLIAENLDKPLYITNYPNVNNRLLVVEQNGVVRIIQDGKVLEQVFLDISDRTHQPFYPADERGMLGFSFHPNFEDNHYFYVNYVDKDEYSVISQYKVKNKIGDVTSEKILMKIKQPYMNHNGGFIEFGPDGYLYISVGDGGSAGDPEGRAQNLSNFFGTILRIDVNSKKSYNIPKDNPFYNEENIKKEIWHYGLRNVWRFSFDMKTGDMYIGDVGQNNWEEINFQTGNSKGGYNFGWNILEGTHCYPEEVTECTKINFVMPLFEYPNDANYLKTLVGWKQTGVEGCSVTGGYVYRGNNIPELHGRYFFGDYCTGNIWSLNIKKNNLDLRNHTDEIIKSINKKTFYLSSFGEDQEGELYIIDYSGYVYSITR